MSVDILVLNSHSQLTRNTEATIPVYNYLTLNGLNIRHGCLFNGFFLILKYRPKVVFFEEIFGGRWHCIVAMFAKSMGCKVVSLLAEGASFTWAKASPEKLWGWLHEQQDFWDAYFFWNQATLNLFSAFYPEASGDIPMAGGCGYDRYKFSCPSTLDIDKSKFAVTVGVGCWIFTEENLSLEWYAKNRELFSKTLHEIIKQNKDILFLIKPHPSNDGGLYYSAVENCVHEENVRLLAADTPIINCIASSDIWLSFESNTAMEAWLLEKQTALLNPTGIEFPYERQGFWKGQPNYATAQEWTAALSCFKQTGELPGFDKLEKERNELYRETIGYADGLNHIRTGNRILDILNSKNTKKSSLPPMPWLKLAINSFLRWQFSRFHKYMPKSIPWFLAFEEFYEAHRKNYSEEEFSINAAIRKKEQLHFYQKNNLDRNKLRKIY